jgi:hypothetical protein
MTLRPSPVLACLTVGIAILCIRSPLAAQGSDPVSVKAQSALVADLELPDAPEPQQPQTPVTTPPTATPDGSQQPAAASSASSTDGIASPDSGAQQTNGDASKAAPDAKSQHDKAEEQLKQERKQRIGILPNFNASYISGAVPLTAGQKFRLMFSTEKDPATFGFSMLVALIGQAEGSHPAYGGGIGGYGKRLGQNYADTFDGAFWGNAVLPSLWHQDPRYFRLGQGPAMHRIFYALSTNVRAKHDGTGKWEPNYSNLAGNLISGGISNIYLPANERGLGSTFEGAFLVTVEGGVGSMLEEFWPDFIHYLQHRKQRKQAAGVADGAKP